MMTKKAIVIILCLLAAYIVFAALIRTKIRTAGPVRSVEQVKAGSEAGNFTLTSPSGEEISLDSFRNRSIVVMCIGNPYT